MARLDEIYNKILLLNREAGKIQEMATGSDPWSELGEKIDKPDNADEMMKYNFVLQTLDRLYEINADILYLQKSVQSKGKLRKNSRGRYEIPDYEWTSGREIEALIENVWIHSRVEHNGEDYYIVGYSSIPMEGLAVRVR